ncbi:hypothetical protein H5T87_08340 [bacterium]|nr:hypothetical protein [bacterium]
MRYRKAYFVLLLFSFLSIYTLEGSDLQMDSNAKYDSLREKFLNPPADSRILKIVHSLPDAPEQQEALFRGLISQGFGGVVCNVSFQDYLLSEDKWQAFVRGVKRAKELGMALWLYDERGYPSGCAGGLTLKDNPEWEARGILCLEKIVKGGEEIELDLPPGQLRKVMAFPLSDKGIDIKKGIDISSSISDGKLHWKAPEGEWHLIVLSESRLYENTHAAISLADKLPYINLLLPEPTRKFIELTHEQYAKHLGEDLSKYFIATFTDEPSLMSYFFLPTPYRPIPWSTNLPEEFKRRRGYELEPFIPLLFVEGEGYKKVRYDFWQTVGKLVAENFFGQIRDWCRKHNIASGGHLLLEESLTAHIALYGNFFLCAKYLDAPSIDCLTSIPSEVPWQIARLIGSIRDLNHSLYTMCETSDFVQVYRPQGDTRPVRIVSEEEIRGTCNRLIHGGINTITSYYTFRDLSDDQLRRLNTWVGRCCTMLRGGYQVADIAVLYPVESLWVNFRPAKQGATDSPIAHKIEATYNQVSYSLYNSNRDFCYIDTPTLAQASLEGDSLVYNNLRWRVIVLPYVDTLPLKVWRKLYQFWEKGGAIVAIGAIPQNSESEFPCKEMSRQAEELFGKGQELQLRTNRNRGVAIFIPEGATSILSTILDKVIEPDVVIAEGDTPIRITHRRIGKRDIYFIINDSEKTCKANLVFRAPKGEIWDPKDGTIKPIQNSRRVEVELEPYGGLFFVFSEVEKPKRLLPKKLSLIIDIQPLKSTSQTIGKGEFVEGEFKQVNVEKESFWETRGKLQKSDVDCFLFLSFHFSQPIDLSRAEYLHFYITIPEGQNSLAPLYVFLHDASGIQSIADTGLHLNEPGKKQLFLHIASFKPWNQQPMVDLSRIVAISIGWGGYYGKEGEELSFLVSQPGLVSR